MTKHIKKHIKLLLLAIATGFAITGLAIGGTGLAVAQQSTGSRIFYLDWREFSGDHPLDPIVQSLTDPLKVEFFKFYEGLMRLPGFRYKPYDLNGDGRNEIVVIVNEDDSEWGMLCEKDEPRNCPVMILSYSSQDGKYKNLGVFRSSQLLTVVMKEKGQYADFVSPVNVKGKQVNVTFSMNPKTGQYERRK